MLTFIYRNHTVEHLFDRLNTHYSGFGSVEEVSNKYSKIIWYHKLSPIGNSIQIAGEIDEINKKLQIVFDGGCKSRVCLIILPSLAGSSRFEMFDVICEKAMERLYFNAISIKEKHKNINIVKEDDFIANAIQYYNPKFYYSAGVIIDLNLSSMFKTWISDIDNALSQKRKKCLILDCDNTLWGGIVGEDGINGVLLGEGYPGNAYKDFQRLILEIKRTGILLALCSKNNAADVWEMFDNHPSMILKNSDISCSRINWSDKNKNIVEIAGELNISIDSMVFVDDSPIERELVRTELPNVVVPDFPSQAYELPGFGETIYRKYFRISNISHDDKERTKFYQDNALRNKFKSEFRSKEDYLFGLNMEVLFYINDENQYVRIAQMTQKTNQFNLTTRRYSENEINDFAMSGGYIACLRLRDKFGDNGVVAVAMIKTVNLDAKIDVFLMSCRVIGRDVEKCFFQLIHNYLAETGVRNITGEYIPTSKNTQVKQFYPSLGFTLSSRTNQGAEIYNLNVNGKIELEKTFTILKTI